MPRPLALHPSERVDLNDLEAVSQYAGGMVAEFGRLMVVDHQCRVLRGFRVELADQNTYPGRITVHGGAVLRPDGQTVFNEDDAGVSRTITLEGASTTFFVEVEYLEADATIDGRAFWDPTVPQTNEPSGDPSPSGQEFTVNVPSRKTRDWRIVQPVRTGSQGFERDQFASTSSKIPIFKIATDSNNKILVGSNPGLATEKAATVLLQQVTATQIIVQDPLCLPAAGASLVVGEGEANVETVSIISIDRALGAVTVTSLANTHDPGQIVRGGTSTANYLTDAEYGIYRRRQPGVTTYDFRDRMWQGDEVHGSILKRGYGGVHSATDRNLQSLKDQVDFMAAQLQELKWGVADPYAAPLSTDRLPPGDGTLLFPTTPRYYDRTGGLASGRAPAITIGDGISSFGDLNGNSWLVFQAAHDALPFGGTILVKPGAYTLNGTVGITNSVVFKGWGSLNGSDQVTIITGTNGKFAISTSNWVGGFENLILDGTTAPASSVALSVNDLGTYTLGLRRVTFMHSRLLLSTGIASDKCVFYDCHWYGSMAGTDGKSLLEARTKLQGLFDHCTFYHNNALASTNCLGGNAGGPALLGRTEFHYCSFQALGTAVNEAAKITTTESVTFTECDISGLLGSYTKAGIVFTSGSYGIMVRNCTLIDRSLYFDTCTNVTVADCQGTVTSNAIANGPMAFTDCSMVLVEGCMINGVGSAIQGDAGGIEIHCSNGFIGKDFNISNNTVYGGKDGVSGILTNCVGVGTLASFNIHGNHILNCSVGIWFKGDSGYVVEDCGIVNNQILDYGVSPLEGNRMLAGVYVDTNFVIFNWSICSNEIAGANVKSTTQLDGLDTRAGILIKSDLIAAYGITIQGNAIRYIGVAGGNVAGTGMSGYGIKLDIVTQVLVAGNVINNIATYNAATVGIAVGLHASTSTNCTVEGNALGLLSSVSGFTYGIKGGLGVSSGEINQFSVVNNTLKGLSGVHGKMSAIELSSASIYDCSVVGNNLRLSYNSGDGHDGNGIWIATDSNLKGLTINNNTIRGEGANAMGCGIGVGTLGRMQDITICGNTIRDDTQSLTTYLHPLWVLGPNNSSAAARNEELITINGNSIFSAIGPAVLVQGVKGVNLTGNTARCAAYTDPFPGTNYNGTIYVQNVKFCSIFGNTVTYDGTDVDAPTDHPAIGMGPGCDVVSVCGNVIVSEGAFDATLGHSFRGDDSVSTNAGTCTAGNLAPNIGIQPTGDHGNKDWNFSFGAYTVGAWT